MNGKINLAVLPLLALVLSILFINWDPLLSTVSAATNRQNNRQPIRRGNHPSNRQTSQQTTQENQSAAITVGKRRENFQLNKCKILFRKLLRRVGTMMANIMKFSELAAILDIHQFDLQIPLKQ